MQSSCECLTSLLRRFSELVGLSVVPSTDALNPRIFVLTPHWFDTPLSVLRELETTAHMTSGVEVRGLINDFSTCCKTASSVSKLSAALRCAGCARAIASGRSLAIKNNLA